MPLLVDPAVEILQKGQVGGEKPFDGPGGHLRHSTEPGDHPGQQQDSQIGLVTTHPRGSWGETLGAGAGEPHHTLAMYGSGFVDVAAWQREGEFRVQGRGGGRAIDLRHAGYRTHLTRSKPSMTMVASSVTTSFDPALRLPVVSLEGQAFTKFQRATSPAS